MRSWQKNFTFSIPFSTIHLVQFEPTNAHDFTKVTMLQHTAVTCGGLTAPSRGNTQCTCRTHSATVLCNCMQPGDGPVRPKHVGANFTFIWPCIVTNFFIIKPTRCTNSQIYFGMKLYVFRTVALSIISLFTVNTAVVYVIQVCKQLSSRTRMELQLHPGPAQKPEATLAYFEAILTLLHIQWRPHIIIADNVINRLLLSKSVVPKHSI